MDTVELRVRMPRDLKNWLATKAQNEGRSVSMQTVQLLRAAMRADDQQSER